MKVAILTYGTRGDVQPYAVLGHALAQRGHDVRIGVCENLVAMTEGIGLETVSIPFDTQDFMSSDQGRAFLSAGKTTTFLKEVMRRETAVRDAIGEAFIATTRDADVIISNVLTITRAASIVEVTGARLLAVYTVPLEPTAEFASPYLFRSTKAPTQVLRRFSHVIFESVYCQAARKNDRAFRRQLGLPHRRGNDLRALRAARLPVQHLLTSELMPAPHDWPSHVRNIGCVGVPEHLRTAWGESVDDGALSRWLDAGKPPVFFGFGSMPVLDPAAAMTMIEEVARRLGVRALVGAGWSDLAKKSSDDVLVVKAFDHGSVLPRCAAAVHHGGAGTTQSVMAAGIPALVTHVFADQPLWGSRVAAQGLGAHVAYQSLTSDRLVAMLAPLLDPSVKRRAEQAAQAMAEEDAVGQVISLVEEVV